MVLFTHSLKALAAFALFALPFCIDAHPISADQAITAIDTLSTATGVQHQARAVNSLKPRFFDFFLVPGKGKDGTSSLLFKGFHLNGPPPPFAFKKGGDSHEHGGQGPHKADPHDDKPKGEGVKKEEEGSEKGNKDKMKGGEDGKKGEEGGKKGGDKGKKGGEEGEKGGNEGKKGGEEGEKKGEEQGKKGDKKGKSSLVGDKKGGEM